jgi:hypothetical protein
VTATAISPASEIAALKLDADQVILSSGLLGTAYRLSVWCDFRYDS